MRMVRAKLRPHRKPYAYTPRGFELRMKPKLLAMGFTLKQYEKLKRLYFCKWYQKHLNMQGFYCNQRQNRLYELARGQSYDRKSRLFRFVERSEIFDCFYADDGSFAGFRSPRAAVVLGLVF